jgi:hypothetical protein
VDCELDERARGPAVAQRLDRLAREQLAVAVVDRLDLVALLEPRVVQVVLEPDLARERLRAGAVVGGCHGLPA